MNKLGKIGLRTIVPCDRDLFAVRLPKTRPEPYSQSCTCVSKVNFCEYIKRDHKEEEGDLPVLPGVLTQSAVQITFVDEEDITVAHSASGGACGEVDEYDTDTDTDTGNDFSELSEVPVSRACTTRSGRVVRAYLRLDV